MDTKEKRDVQVCDLNEGVVNDGRQGGVMNEWMDGT